MNERPQPGDPVLLDDSHPFRDYVSASQAAAQLGITIPAILRRISRGYIPALKRHGIWFLLQSDVDRAVQMGRIKRGRVPRRRTRHETSASG